MTQVVDGLMVTDGPASYFSASYRVAVEDFIPTLLAASSTQPTVVDPATTNRFTNDFYGLLTFLRIPLKYHFAIMRLNGMVSPEDYLPQLTDILMPDTKELDRIAQTNNSTTINNS